MACCKKSSVLLLLLSAWMSAGLRHERSSQNSTGPITSVMAPVRHLFVAGTDGSGLEFWKEMMRDCIEGKVCEARDPTFTSTLMFQQDNEQEVMRAWGRNRPNPQHLVPLNLVAPNGSALADDLFLRPFAGRAVTDKTDPELALYAKAAAKYGDILKVLVLIRNEKSLLKSYMTKQKMKADAAEDLAVENVNQMASEIRKLPKGIVRCQRFEDLLGLGEHMAPLLSREDEDGMDFVRLCYKAALKAHPDCKKKLCKPAPRLRAALDELESLCPPADLGFSHNSTTLSLREVREQEAIYDDKLRWLLD